MKTKAELTQRLQKLTDKINGKDRTRIVEIIKDGKTSYQKVKKRSNPPVLFSRPKDADAGRVLVSFGKFKVK